MSDFELDISDGMFDVQDMVDEPEVRIWAGRSNALLTLYHVKYSKRMGWYAFDQDHNTIFLDDYDQVEYHLLPGLWLTLRTDVPPH